MKTSRTKSREDAEAKEEEPIYNFDEASIRVSFTRKVYGLVFAQLAIILAFVVAFSLKEFKQAVGGLIWIATIAAIFLGVVLLIIIACSSTARKSHPCNLILLSTLSICQGWCVGALCSIIPGDIPTISCSLAAIVVLGLTIITCSFKSLSFWWSLISVLLLLSASTPAFAFLFPTVAFPALFYIAIGVFIFGLFLIVDLLRMTEGYYWNYTFDQEEYILASLFVLVDIIDCIIQFLRVVYLCFHMFDSC